MKIWWLLNSWVPRPYFINICSRDVSCSELSQLDSRRGVATCSPRDPDCCTREILLIPTYVECDYYQSMIPWNNVFDITWVVRQLHQTAWVIRFKSVRGRCMQCHIRQESKDGYREEETGSQRDRQRASDSWRDFSRSPSVSPESRIGLYARLSLRLVFLRGKTSFKITYNSTLWYEEAAIRRVSVVPVKCVQKNY